VATEQHAPLPSPPQDGPPSLAVEGTAASHRGRRRHWAAQRPSGGSPFSAAFAAEHAGLILAIVLGVLLPVVVAAATGNLSIPHNDAWSYSRIAQTFGRTGHIRLLDWNRSALVGQFVVLGPLASSIVVQQLFVAVLAVVGLFAVYDLTRPALGTRGAGYATLVVALWPGFGLLATSFMPDVPALTAALLCLALGRRALERGSMVLFVLSMACGLWGMTIREQSGAAPVAVAVCALAIDRYRRALRPLMTIGVTILAAVLYLGFDAWHSGLPKVDPPNYAVVTSTLGTAVNLICRSWFTLALPLAPAVAYAARPWRWRRHSQIAAVLTAAAAVMTVHDFHPKNLFLGNYLAWNGAYAAVMPDGDDRVVFPHHFWWLVVAAACLSGSLLTGLVIENYRRVGPILGVFTLVTAVGTVATNLLGQNISDRYLIALAPGLLVIVLAPAVERDIPRMRRRLIAPVAAGLAVGLLSLAITANGFSFDTQRWRTATQVAQSGVPAARIDAGLEWLGYYSPAGMVDRYPSSGMGFEGYFSRVASCRVITMGKVSRHGWKLERVVTYSTFLVAGTSRLYVYDSGTPC